MILQALQYDRSLVAIGFFSLVILFYLFTAKRYNFIHAFIGFFTCVFLFSGIHAVMVKYMSLDDLVANEYIVLFFDCIQYLLLISNTLMVYILDFLADVNLLQHIADYTYIIYFCPIIIWFISRLISGKIRKRNKYKYI